MAGQEFCVSILTLTKPQASQRCGASSAEPCTLGEIPVTVGCVGLGSWQRAGLADWTVPSAVGQVIAATGLF